MVFSFGKHSILILILIFVCALSVFAGDEWRAVSPEELQMKTPKVEADADAEAIFWEIWVDDSTANLIEDNYVRIKIFTESGREKYSKIDIPFLKGTKISDVRARIIKPDGSIVNIDKNEVFERDILKADSVKFKAKSFAVPNIEPGIILEYRYKEIYRNFSVGSMALRFQREIPIQEMSYYVRPYPGAPMNSLSINMKNAEWVKVKDKRGFSVATQHNIPALKTEPFMPPSDQVRSWMLIFYNQNESKTTDEYWRQFAKVREVWHKTFLPKDEIKAILPGIIGSATTAEEKLSRIYRYCKTQIKNITYDPSLTDEQRDAVSKNIETAVDVIKAGKGNSAEINTLFGALATAAGYEARWVLSGDRSKFFFNSSYANSRFVHVSSIAVKTEKGWQFYDPGSYFTPEGMLLWHDEDVTSMLIGKSDFVWVNTKISEPDKSVSKRTGKFTLSGDGTLEGTVKIEYTGHRGVDAKLINYEDSPGEREKRLIDEIKTRMSTAELSNISIENVADPEKPFTYQYNVRIPNYAQRTGKRLFFQPNFFEYGVKPIFSSAVRKHDIYFAYPWAENDFIEIKLPNGFELESPDSPGEIADPSRIGALSIKIGASAAIVRYQRKFHFGGGGRILFPVESYPVLKNLFDAFNKADTHIITLREK